MSALPSIIAMKHSPRHFDDLSYKGEPLTLRQMLTILYENAVSMAAQRAFGGEHCERIADSGELLMLEYKEQIRLIENITKEARKAFIEISLNPDLEIG